MTESFNSFIRQNDMLDKNIESILEKQSFITKKERCLSNISMFSLLNLNIKYIKKVKHFYLILI